MGPARELRDEFVLNDIDGGFEGARQVRLREAFEALAEVTFDEAERNAVYLKVIEVQCANAAAYHYIFEELL